MSTLSSIDTHFEAFQLYMHAGIFLILHEKSISCTKNACFVVVVYRNYVLGLSDGIEETGAPQWRLVLCLLFSWTLVFLCLIKGIKSAGKVCHNMIIALQNEYFLGNLSVCLFYLFVWLYFTLQ